MKNNIKKSALRYSGMIGAIVGAHQAKAQVVYTDIADKTLNTNNQTFDLNIDNDTSGVVDFRLIQYVDTTQFNISGSFLQARGSLRNQAVGLDYANYYYPFKLNLGNVIGPDTVFNGLGTSQRWGQLALSVNDTTYPNDQFKGGVNDAFIGIRFEGVQDDTIRTFFGWIRVDVAADLKSITVKDYAYQSQPFTEISAGEGSPLSTPEVEIPQLQMVQRGQFLDIELPEEMHARSGQLSFTDLSGRKLNTHAFTGKSYRHELQGLPKGVLVATVEAEGTRQSLKVVVY